jgi:molybdopterin biosynthesis enzyme
VPKDRERRAYLRVIVRSAADGWLATPAGGQSSAQLRGLAAANALLAIPEGEPAGDAGARYDATLLRGIT